MRWPNGQGSGCATVAAPRDPPSIPWLLLFLLDGPSSDEPRLSGTDVETNMMC